MIFNICPNPEGSVENQFASAIWRNGATKLILLTIIIIHEMQNLNSKQFLNEVTILSFLSQS